MNEKQNKKDGLAEEDLEPRPSMLTMQDTVSDISFINSKQKNERKKKWEQEIAERVVIDHSHLANSEFYKSDIQTATDLQHLVWT